MQFPVHAFLGLLSEGGYIAMTILDIGIGSLRSSCLYGLILATLFTGIFLQVVTAMALADWE